MSSCVRCYVSGRVQGVFFRTSTRRKAEELGVDGWARNLADGRVEVLACGEQTAVEALKDWLWLGPGHARVADVQCEPAPAQDMAGFRER